jgi:hypothetical protein
VSGLPVRVLLDTGPTEEEAAKIASIFRAHGMTAVTEGHSYGGPPPTSAFLIVVSAPLTALLDRVADEPHGEAGLQRMVASLFALRADSQRWGRPHEVRLEDATAPLTIPLPTDLPAAAYLALTQADLSRIDRHSPPTQLVWSPVFDRWMAQLFTSPQSVTRRVPARPYPATSEPSVVGTTSEQLARLCAIADSLDGSAVTRQRASTVLASSFGYSVPSIAHRLMMSPVRVRTVIRNFNRDGFAALDLGYRGGLAVQPTAVEQCDALQVASRNPRAFGVDADTWDIDSLAQVLVGTGLAEDADRGWLGSLLRQRQPCLEV